MTISRAVMHPCGNSAASTTCMVLHELLLAVCWLQARGYGSAGQA